MSYSFEVLSEEPPSYVPLRYKAYEKLLYADVFTLLPSHCPSLPLSYSVFRCYLVHPCAQASIIWKTLLTLSPHAHESYCSQFVCLCVCYQSSASVRRSCTKMNLPDRYLLIFNLAILLTSSLSQVIACFLFRTAKRVAICNCQ